MLLMIDEEKRRMVTCKQYLEESGYEVMFIEDIDQAYQFIERYNFRIQALILDIMMPWGELFTREETETGILTGYAFLKKIRKSLLPSTPVIIYTAVNKPDLFRELKHQVNCSVIHKPDPPSKIVRELKKLGILPNDNE